MTRKRIAAFVLVLCLVLTVVPVMAFAAANPFRDVDASDWFYDSVQYVYSHRMMSGTGTGTFSPRVLTTRGMVVTILYSMDGSPDVKAQAFEDVPAKAYYARAAAWSVEKGILEGRSKTEFAPADPISRELLATTLYNYAAYKEYDVSAANDLKRFTDAGKIDASARTAMGWAVAEHLLAGISARELDPKGCTSRGQLATILNRFCVNVVPEAPRPIKPDNPSDADNYYWDNSEVLEVKSAPASPELTTGAQTKNLLDGRGFDVFPIYCEYDINGNYIELQEIPADTADKYPMYQTYYMSAAKEMWTVFVIDGKIFANPVSYNMTSGLGVQLLVSESEVLTSYDEEGNLYYVNIPKDTAVITKVVDRIDAATLDTLTVEVLGK